MQPRKYRKIYQQEMPVRGVPQQEVPEKPGMFAGKQRRQEYQEGLDARAAEEVILDERFAREMQGFDQGVARNNRQADMNRRAAERRMMMQNMPQNIKSNPNAQFLGDRVIDAKHFAQDTVALPGRVHPGYYIGGAAAIGSAGLLNAYSQLQQDNLDRGPIATTARATSNIFDGMGSAYSNSYGQDPLAQARNHVADAQEMLGSPTLLEAVVYDQVEGNPMASGVPDQGIEFVKEVEDLASYLLTVPSRNAEGNYIYMSPRDAYSQARQMIELDQNY